MAMNDPTGRGVIAPGPDTTLPPRKANPTSSNVSRLETAKTGIGFGDRANSASKQSESPVRLTDIARATSCRLDWPREHAKGEGDAAAPRRMRPDEFRPSIRAWTSQTDDIPDREITPPAETIARDNQTESDTDGREDAREIAKPHDNYTAKLRRPAEGMGAIAKDEPVARSEQTEPPLPEDNGGRLRLLLLLPLLMVLGAGAAGGGYWAGTYFWQPADGTDNFAEFARPPTITPPDSKVGSGPRVATADRVSADATGRNGASASAASASAASASAASGNETVRERTRGVAGATPKAEPPAAATATPLTPALAAAEALPEAPPAADPAIDVPPTDVPSADVPSAIEPVRATPEPVPQTQPVQQQDVAAVAPPSGPAVADASPANPDAAALVGEGHDLMASGDLSGARQRFEAGLKSGLPEAALALGRSYDPAYVAPLAGINAEPDAARAREYYEEWYRLGVEQGAISPEMHLDRLLQAMQPE